VDLYSALIVVPHTQGAPTNNQPTNENDSSDIRYKMYCNICTYETTMKHLLRCLFENYFFTSIEIW